jgi:endonuclease VIII
MPEGDTIHKAAARLRPALLGAPLVRFEARRLVASPDLRPRPGMVIEDVEAVGKHLLVRFDAGMVLRVHLGMPGSWHLYRPGQRWQKPPHRARVVLEVPDWVAVCFSAPTVSVHRAPSGPAPLQPVAHLGPDLVGGEHTPDEVAALAVARMARLVPPGRAIAEVLLDQRVAPGVGNVYKSEVLWACGIEPFRSVEDVTDHERHELLATAARQLRSNLGRARRSTVPGGGLAVYGRAGSPCRRCGTLVRSRRQGEQARRTFWCPGCQE